MGGKGWGVGAGCAGRGGGITDTVRVSALKVDSRIKLLPPSRNRTRV